MGQGQWDPLTSISLPQTPECTGHVDKNLPSVANSSFPPEFILPGPEELLTEESMQHDNDPDLDKQLQTLGEEV